MTGISTADDTKEASQQEQHQKRDSAKSKEADKSWSHLWLQGHLQGCLKLAANCNSTQQPMEPGHVMPLWHACHVLTLQLVEGICPGEAFRPRTVLQPLQPYLLWKQVLTSHTVSVEILWTSPHLWPSQLITTQHFLPQLLQSAQSLKKKGGNFPCAVHCRKSTIHCHLS